MAARTNLVLWSLIGFSLSPFLWLLTKDELFSSSIHAVANIIGLIGSVLIIWQLVLRTRVISSLFAGDYLSFDSVHKTVGIWGMLLVFMHPLLEQLQYSESLFWILSLDFRTSAGEFEQKVSFGRLAFITLFVTWVLSALLRHKLPYRLWRRSHLIVYAIVPLVFLHAPAIGTYLNNLPAIKAYWYSWIILWVGLVSWRILVFLNVGKVRSRLVEKNTLPGGITRYSLMPKSRKLQPKPGQFLYIRCSFFSELHPFSVMEYDESTGSIVLGIKAVGKYTRQLETLRIGDCVYIDGPYGLFTREGHNQEPKVIIAGGIGITPFVELIKRFGSKNTRLIYANRNLDLAINRDLFRRELLSNYVDVVSDEAKINPPAIKGRVDINSLQRTLPKDSFTTNRFFVCGPRPFMAAVTKALMELGVKKKQIFTEEFSL